MKIFCFSHKEEHDDYSWRTISVPIKRGKNKGKTRTEWICSSGSYETKKDPIAFNIGVSKKDARMAHWRDIKNRVTTHEGEALKGVKGADYNRKYSRQYLGKDLSRPTDFSQAQYQKELAKTI
jgi:hypothetical protein